MPKCPLAQKCSGFCPECNQIARAAFTGNAAGNYKPYTEFLAWRDELMYPGIRSSVESEPSVRNVPSPPPLFGLHVGAPLDRTPEPVEHKFAAILKGSRHMPSPPSFYGLKRRH